MTAESSKKPNPRNTTHGLTLMKRAVKAHGMQEIDGRTKLAKALDHWRDQLLSDLWENEQASTQQLTIVNLAVKTKLHLDSINSWLLQQPTLVNTRKRTLLPVVLQRQQLADALARYMTQLGLDRKAKQLPTLSEYLNGNKAAPAMANTKPSTVEPPGGASPDEAMQETTHITP